MKKLGRGALMGILLFFSAQVVHAKEIVLENALIPIGGEYKAKFFGKTMYVIKNIDSRKILIKYFDGVDWECLIQYNNKNIKCFENGHLVLDEKSPYRIETNYFVINGSIIRNKNGSVRSYGSVSM